MSSYLKVFRPITK